MKQPSKGIAVLVCSCLALIATGCGSHTEQGRSSSSSWGTIDNRTSDQMFLDRARVLSRQADPDSCSRNYQSMFSDRALDIYIALGYGDDEKGGITLDGSGHSKLVNFLSKPCRVSNYQACGFDIVEGHAYSQKTTLEKTITNRLNNRSEKARIRIIHSSATPSHYKNTQGEAARQQRTYSYDAKQFFYEGIRSGDVVFYEGHARDGGGPDFEPAIMRGGGVNYAAYKGPNSNYRQMLAALRRGYSVKLLGLWGCATRRLWKTGIESAAGDNLGLILTNKVDYKLKYQVSLMGALNSVLSQRCQSSFKESLYGATQTYASQTANIYNFF